MNLVVNTLIQYGQEPREVERLLWMDAKRVNCYVINIHADRFPILKSLKEIEQGARDGTISILEQEERFIPLSYDLLSDKAKKQLEIAWSIIENLVSSESEPSIFDPHIRKEMLMEKAALHGVSEKTIGRYLRSFWKKGKTKLALAPEFSKRGGIGKSKASGQSKRGRPRKYSLSEGINVTEEVESNFRIALKRYYYTSKKAPLKFAYHKLIQEFYSNNYKLDDGVKIPIVQNPTLIPTFTQFKYFFQKENTIKKEISTRYSSKRYELSHRPVLKSATHEVIGPGSKFLLDGTSFDIYLVSRINRNWIVGRPCLFYVMDVFSRKVTGLYIGFENSWLSAAMAIVNCCEDKVSFCEQYGITIRPEEWEAKHLPETILGDRGELFSKEVETLIQNLHVKIENTSSYRGDLKSVVERHFKTTNDSVKMMLPGVINPDFKQRGPQSKDYRLDAKLDIYQFTQIIIRCVLHHNNHYLPNYPREEMMINDDVNSIPSEIWRWGIQNRSGKLREVPKDVVLLNVLPAANALVTYQGIKFNGLYYSSQTALKERWMEKARRGSWKVAVSYDPRNVRVIYLRGVSKRGYEQCFLLSQYSQYADRTNDEMEYLHAMENMQKSKFAEKELQPHIDLITHIEAIVKEAEQQTKEQQVSGSKAEKLSGIREHRRIESELYNHNGATSMYSVNDNATVIQTSAKDTAAEDYFNDFEFLKKQQKEQKLIERLDTNT